MYPPGKFGYTWKHWTLQPWNLLWILPDNSYGFFQTTPLDLHDPWPNWQGCFLESCQVDRNIDLRTKCRYPILLHWRMWSPGTPGHGVTFCYPVPLGPLFRGPCHFGPSCAEKTTALKLMLLLWIIDTMMEYAFCEAVKNPMDNGLTHQVPLSITTDSTFGVPMVWCQARWRLQLLRRWLLCKSCILGHFYVSENSGFIVLWFYIHLDSFSSIWEFCSLLKCINIHYEYLTSNTKMWPSICLQVL